MTDKDQGAAPFEKAAEDPAASKRIPLPAYVSGIRAWIAGEEVIVICGADDHGYAYVLCGRDAHLAARADAKAMAAGLNSSAAASAMLAALKGMVDGVMHADPQTLLATPWMSRMTQNQLDAARAAIAQAEKAGIK
jgi:hypothetical protein